MRYKVLDSWRGIAALLVAAFHFPVSGLIHNAPVVRHAYLFVDFFFVLSGFVIAHAARDGLVGRGAVAAFMTRRFGRVYPLYFAVLVAFLAIELVKLFATIRLNIGVDTPPFAAGSPSDPAALLLHAGLLQVFGLTDGLSWNWPDWSIAGEFWTYLVFALVAWAFPNARVPVLLCLSLLALAIMAPQSQRGIDLTYDFGFLRSLYGFSIGAITYEIARKRRPWAGGASATALELAVLAVTLAFVASSGRRSMSFAAPFVFAGTILVFSQESGALSNSLRKRPWQRLGALSYSIYIVHAFIVFVFTLGVSYAQHRSPAPLWQFETVDGAQSRVLATPSWLLADGIALAYLALVILISTLTNRYIETPARNYFNARSTTWWSPASDKRPLVKQNAHESA